MLATRSGGEVTDETPEERPARVLVADDSLEMARSVADSLGDRGYEATAAGSGGEAQHLLSERTFDALVTDLRMPGIDGLALMARSRSLDPDRPVIAMTAYGSIDIALESLRQGAYQVLTKPFKQEELAIFLGRALDEARRRREVRTLETALRHWAAIVLRGSGGQLDAAAEQLGVDARTLRRWLAGRA